MLPIKSSFPLYVREIPSKMHGLSVTSNGAVDEQKSTMVASYNLSIICLYNFAGGFLF